MPLTSYQAEVALETLSRYSRQLNESVDTPLKALVLRMLVQEHAQRRIQHDARTPHAGSACAT